MTPVYEDFARAYVTEVGGAVRHMLTRHTGAVDLLAKATADAGEVRALAGEHFAHNLAWDAPLGVDGVQPPLVVCDPSLADMSAILNDHPDPAHGVRYQLSSASPEDVVFLLAYDSAGRTTREAVSAATVAGTRPFLLHRDGPGHSGAGARHFRLPRVDDFALAALVQSVAHLLCRTTRAALTADAANSAAALSPDDLMAQDLAPLRELSDTPSL